jgi:transposase
MKQRFIEGLNPETVDLLHWIYQRSVHQQVRQRAHCILLSFAGFNVTELMRIFGVTRQPIYTWFNAWEHQRLVGLYDQPGRGRNPTFNDAEKAQIRDWAKASPNQLNRVLAKIQANWHIEVSKTTLTRILKSFAMSWHRLRRVLAGPPDPVEYATKQPPLAVLKRQDAQGELDLRYLDESGFC